MSKKSKNRHTRGSSRNATQRVRLPNPNLTQTLVADLNDLNSLTEIEDLRQKFVTTPIPRRIDSKHIRLAPRPIHRDNFDHIQPAPFLGFENPLMVVRCIRKKARKQVLHAFKKTGKGGQKKPRRKQSEIRC